MPLCCGFGRIHAFTHPSRLPRGVSKMKLYLLTLESPILVFERRDLAEDYVKNAYSGALEAGYNHLETIVEIEVKATKVKAS